MEDRQFRKKRKNGGFFVFAGIAILPSCCLFLPDYCRTTAIDRIVAVNVIGTKTTVLLVIIGMIFSEACSGLRPHLHVGIYWIAGCLPLLRSRQSGKTLHAARNQEQEL